MIPQLFYIVHIILGDSMLLATLTVSGLYGGQAPSLFLFVVLPGSPEIISNLISTV